MPSAFVGMIAESIVDPRLAPTALRLIASHQRALIVCVVANVAAAFILSGDQGGIVDVALLAVAIAGAIFVFKLSIRLFGTAVGVLLGCTSLVPLLGLIPLLVINGKATAVLTRHGLKVGLLGVDPGQLPPAPGPSS